MDFTDEESIKKAVGGYGDGPLDILVNNGGQ